MSVSTTYKNYTAKWFTPPRWIEWVTTTLGKSYFDPCPDDWDSNPSPCGLTTDWMMTNGAFYCNHPGSRGSTKVWWNKFASECGRGGRGIWCAFSIEQLRHMDPSPFDMDGWLVMPRKRISFIDARTGLPGKSPSNWAVFWSSVMPAEPPEDCVIVRTGR